MTKGRFLDRNSAPHIVTLVLIAGLAALTMNIFLPALPDMARYFNADYTVMQMSISGYLAGTAVLQVFLGPLSDRFGRRPVMIASLVTMLVATLICILAETVAVFMIGRLLQTTVVAGLVLSRAVVRDIVPMNEAASMIGYITMGMTLAPMVGPTLGGFLNDLFGWQANFVVLLGLGMIVLALVLADLGETNRLRSSSLAAQFRAWPELIGSRRFWGYTLTATFTSGAFFAFLGGAPFVGNVLLKLSPSVLGMQFFFVAAGYMAGNYLSGRYARHVGIGAMMLAGCIIGASGTALAIVMILFGEMSTLAFFGPFVIVGLGNGISLPSANAGIVSVMPHLAGSASGLGGAITIGGGAVLSVVAAAVLSTESGAMPLLVVMLASGLLSIAAVLYLLSVERASPDERDPHGDTP
ncbi:MAG: multidrug effflux MFS transporter [Allorhizobium sp.]